ncbi:MAG: 23S rRNA (pseudouridine(1915)-N(3))-methyltransferase RlmH [Oscillospiraceae bacterium]|nr:23S rRNA (pseudouridine(1915)-N(3))-methyltransferase RlmH [Oscillospiraceae bacterium]
MMRIHIAASGRLRERYWIMACDEYKKRLSRFCRVSEHETADTDDPVPLPGFFATALCPEGEMLNSEQFAKTFLAWQNKGVSRIAFLIGGSEGLSDALTLNAGFRLSLSRMTWPHHMVRAMLLEQIYRAFTILEGGKYHK